MNIVEAGSRHLEQVAALFDQYRQFYAQPPDPGKARAYIADRMRNGESVIFLALDGDEAVGFTQLYGTFCSVAAAPIWVLYDLFVRGDARRRGVALALMNRATELGRASRAVRIDLQTAIDNAPARALYEQLGYERDERFYTYSLEL